ncbi:MAG: serine/threonine-protein kinase [Acidobacteriota bacterium]
MPDDLPRQQPRHFGSALRRWLGGRGGSVITSATAIELSASLTEATTAEDWALGLARWIDQLFEPSSLHVFVRRSERFRRFASHDGRVEDAVLLPPDLKILAPSEDSEGNDGTADGRARTVDDLDPRDREFFTTWRAAAVLPIVAPGERRPRALVCLATSRRIGQPLPTLDHLARLAAPPLVTAVHQELETLRGWIKGGTMRECPDCGRCFDSDQVLCPDDDCTLDVSFVDLQRVVANRYRLDQRLGSGGMGSVYRAHDQQRGHDVAIKILSDGDATALGRFANEARVGAALHHPAIVRILDNGALGTDGAFLVMELLDGETLARRLARDGRLEPRALTRLLDPVLDGIHAAHEAGLLHRDLKPHNLMVVADAAGGESLKILDFGLVKLEEDLSESRRLTLQGMVLGTPAYMSPEQLGAEVVDRRSDLFALATIVVECLTGRPAFPAENLGALIRQITTAPFRMRVDTAEQTAVADVLRKALAKAPEDRYPDVKAFQDELMATLERCGERFPAAEERDLTDRPRRGRSTLSGSRAAARA